MTFMCSIAVSAVKEQSWTGVFLGQNTKLSITISTVINNRVIIPPARM